MPADRSSRQEAILTRSANLSDRVKEMVFEIAGAPLRHQPGQWIKFHMPGGVEREYSLAAPWSSEHPRRFELAITLVSGGAGSSWLFGLAPGDRVECSGPFGFFTQSNEALQHSGLYVATGTGLAPLRAMLKATGPLRRGTSAETILLVGGRQEEDLLWRSEFMRWSAQEPSFRFWPTLSCPAPGWSGRHGHVQDHLEEALRTLGSPHVYICGLGDMVRDVRRLLKQNHGLPRARIHAERYD